eukprot:8089345-Pyramimonas_sp.AAC.1
MAQGTSKTPSDGRRWWQDSPTTAHRHPRYGQEGPSTAHESPTSASEGPKTAQDGPKGPPRLPHRRPRPSRGLRVALH